MNITMNSAGTDRAYVNIVKNHYKVSTQFQDEFAKRIYSILAYQNDHFKEGNLKNEYRKETLTMHPYYLVSMLKTGFLQAQK